MTTVTAREFNRDVSAAKRAADDGPVVVTDRGVPAYVLLSIEDYRRLSPSTGPSLVDLLVMEEEIDVEFDKAEFTPKVPEL